MATNLPTLRDRVEARLVDSSNAIWSIGLIDAGIRLALHELSLVNPLVTETTLTSSAASRELDISSLSDVIGIRKIWLPYDSSDPEYPANERVFVWWRDSQTLYFPDGSEPQADDVARIWYETLQTINGLDSAAATSVSELEISRLEGGAAGFAALSRGIDLQEQVRLSRTDAEDISRWGQARVAEFRRWLRSLVPVSGSGVQLPALDRFQGDWA